MACANTSASATWNMPSLKSALPSVHVPSSVCFSTGSSSSSPRVRISVPKPISKQIHSLWVSSSSPASFALFLRFDQYWFYSD